jgi:hypothetical protein
MDGCGNGSGKKRSPLAGQVSGREDGYQIDIAIEGLRAGVTDITGVMLL